MRSAKSVVHLEERRETQRAEDVSPLYGVAMLRIALELKRSGGEGLESILTRVVARMELEERPFRAYLESNGGLLRTIAQRKA